MNLYTKAESNRLEKLCGNTALGSETHHSIILIILLIRHT